jgi:predicted NBD/HSP70 family sugar kinase
MKTADPELMRVINRYHVMDAIRRLGPISRVQISAETELSATTVSAITAALLEDGLIVPRHVPAAPDQPRGRPRVMLELNPGAAAVCGARLASNQITIAVTNFQADILTSASIPVRVDRQPASVVLDLLEDAVRRCVEDAGMHMGDVSGLCVGIPGVIEHASGVCRHSPLFSDRDLDVGHELHARLGISIAVDSDVNLITQAEHWFGHGRSLDSFLVVSVEHTIGLGVVYRGELFRGASGLNPDFGDMVVAPDRLWTNGPGPSRLSAIASTTSIIAAACELVQGSTEDPLLRSPRAMGRIVELATSGHNGMTKILFDAGQALGVAIANLITLFAPPKVILAGSALQAGEFLLGPLHEAVRAATPKALADVAEFVVHDPADDMWARGAAALALRDLYGSPWTKASSSR